MTWLDDRIAAGEIVILDGAIGTELERRGVAMDNDAWCARAVLSDADKVRQLHVDYIDAGADVITTNTFASHRYALEPAGLASQFESINRRAVDLAKEARDKAGNVRPLAIAGAMSHMHPLTKRQQDVTVEVGAAHYRELAELLADAGCDILVLEMMMDAHHAGALLEAAQATGLPVWVGFNIDVRNGKVVCGTRRQKTATLELTQLARPLLATGGTLAGIMHSEVENTDPGITALKKVWDGPLLAYPNSGRWTPPNWVFEDVVDPNMFADAAKKWVERHHVQVLGGCCGIGPDHIRTLRQRLG